MNLRVKMSGQLRQHADLDQQPLQVSTTAAEVKARSGPLSQHVVSYCKGYTQCVMQAHICACKGQDETAENPKQRWFLFFFLGVNKSWPSSGQCKQGKSQFSSLFEQLCIYYIYRGFKVHNRQMFAIFLNWVLILFECYYLSPSKAYYELSQRKLRIVPVKAC